MSSRGIADLRAAQAVADITFHRDKLLLCASLCEVTPRCRSLSLFLSLSLSLSLSLFYSLLLSHPLSPSGPATPVYIAWPHNYTTHRDTRTFTHTRARALTHALVHSPSTRTLTPPECKFNHNFFLVFCIVYDPLSYWGLFLSCAVRPEALPAASSYYFRFVRGDIVADE